MNHDQFMQWSDELKAALQDGSDRATLINMSKGKLIPAWLITDFWKAMFSLCNASKVKLTRDFDLDDQQVIGHDCKLLAERVAEQELEAGGTPMFDLSMEQLIDLQCDFESVLTTYLKTRPKLSYVFDNGWTDIMRVLKKVILEIDLFETMYQLFEHIVDHYIPKDLFIKRIINRSQVVQILSSTQEQPGRDDASGEASTTESTPQISSQDHPTGTTTYANKSAQAYHLLRLLLQYHDPKLSFFLDSKDLHPYLYSEDWFCSLFARCCSYTTSLWVEHFKMADPFLIFFGAATLVLRAGEGDKLTKANKTKSEILQALRSEKLTSWEAQKIDYPIFRQLANSTPCSIRSYSHLFFLSTADKTSPTPDLKTSQLTAALDLSQYLCLPVVPAEIFAMGTAALKTSSNQSPTNTPLNYFLIDCRPADQYNAGHFNGAFNLDSSLMSAAPLAAVEALRQVIESEPKTGGQHLCFIGSGYEDEDRQVNTVLLALLQNYQKYVSIAVGGFHALHDYAISKPELMEIFNELIVDHDDEKCKFCSLQRSSICLGASVGLAKV